MEDDRLTDAQWVFQRASVASGRSSATAERTVYRLIKIESQPWTLLACRRDARGLRPKEIEP